MAPELFGSGAKKTRASDVYAFAMTILEVCLSCFISVLLVNACGKIYTGQAPYPRCGYDFQVLLAISNGVVPDKPGKDSMFYEDLWNLCLQCWAPDHDLRPDMQDVAVAVNVLCMYLSLMLTAST